MKYALVLNGNFLVVSAVFVQPGCYDFGTVYIPSTDRSIISAFDPFKASLQFWGMCEEFGNMDEFCKLEYVQI